MSDLKIRLSATIVLVVMIVVAPFWLYLPALALAVLALPFYWEGVILGFVIDTLYKTQDEKVIFFGFPVAFSVTIVLALMPLGRKYFRLGN